MMNEPPESVRRALEAWHESHNPFHIRDSWEAWDPNDAYLDTPMISPDRIPPGYCQMWDNEDKCYILKKDPWYINGILGIYQTGLINNDMDETESVEVVVDQELLDENPELVEAGVQVGDVGLEADVPVDESQEPEAA